MEVSRFNIWKTLSAVDVRPHLVTDGNLHYLPWAKAHQLMMSIYPEYSWQFSEDDKKREVHYFDDRTAEVRLAMNVEGHTLYTSQTVRGAGVASAAIQNPNAEQIHNAKQRCRVKALGEFGLGFVCWSEPMIPQESKVEPEREEPESDPRDELWEPVCKSKNLSIAKKAAARYQNALRNRKLEDDSEFRLMALTEERGW